MNDDVESYLNASLDYDGNFFCDHLFTIFVSIIFPYAYLDVCLGELCCHDFDRLSQHARRCWDIIPGGAVVKEILPHPVTHAVVRFI